MHRWSLRSLIPSFKKALLPFSLEKNSLCWKCNLIASTKFRAFTIYNHSDETDIVDTLKEKSEGENLREAFKNLTFDDLVPLHDSMTIRQELQTREN